MREQTKKRKENRRNKEALILQEEMKNQGIMEIVEDFYVTTPEKRKRLIESQTNKKDITIFRWKCRIFFCSCGSLFAFKCS